MASPTFLRTLASRVPSFPDARSRRGRGALLLVLLSPLTLALPPPVAPAKAAAPTVITVDPPNWFVGYSLSTIQLLVRGHDLTGAALVSDDPDVVVDGPQRVNADGVYLIATVRIADSATPGPVALRLTRGDASTAVPFELRAKLPREGRFAGLTPDDVVYLLMPDRFADGDTSNDETAGPGTTFDRSNPNYYHGGDLEGVIDHIPYLADLGATAVWLNPVMDNVDARQDYQPYHGYHATDYYRIENHFGTLDDYKALVEAAHARGLKVVMDHVANHTGPQHPWLDSYPTPTWYHGTPANHLTNPFDIRSVVSEIGDAGRRRATLDGWFVDLLPDLNQDDPDVAQYLIQNTLWWIETTGIDAIREDTLPYVPRTFWNRWMTAIKAEYPSFIVVGEVFDGDPAVTSFFQGGEARWDGVDSKVDTVFDFPFLFAVYGAAQGDFLAVLRVFSSDDRYPNPSILVPFVGNHDTERIFHRLVRNAKYVGVAQAILLTSRGIPQLYYGDEIAMDGGGDPDNRRDFPGGWPGDRKNAFTAEGRTKKQNKVFNYLKLLIAVRKATPALTGDTTIPLGSTGANVAYLRRNGDEQALVVVNASTAAAVLQVPVHGVLPNGLVLKDALYGKIRATVSSGRLRVAMKPTSAAVLVPQ
jgi:glycosidase